MNILPKKSWHVRNKDNIERVRRDEENAANEEKDRQRRIALAESEARTEFLRNESRKRLGGPESSETSTALVPAPSKHVNFFEDLEQGKNLTGGNAEYEKEKKEEKEKQEKAIGLLTYLGQSAVEAQTEKPWYFNKPKKEAIPETFTGREKTSEEFSTKKKSLDDPMHMMMKYVETTRKRELGTNYSKPFTGPTRIPQRREGVEIPTTKEQTSGKRKRSRSSSSSSSDSSSSSSSSDSSSDSSDEDRKHKHKKHKKSKKHSKHKKKKSKKHKKKRRRKEKRKSSTELSVVSVAPTPTKTLAQLRAERLQREQAERKRIEKLRAKHRGEEVEEEKDTQPPDDRERRYNSQFNPDLVRVPKKKRKSYEDMI